jgi:hypothetical protein
MKLITSTLQKNDQGAEVKNLHYILFFIQQMLNNSEIAKFFDDPGFQEAYKAEVERQIYGTATLKFVDFMQITYQVQRPEAGVVDRPTADLFNSILKEYSGQSIDVPREYPYTFSNQDPADPTEPILKVFGILRNEYGELINQVIVQVFDRDLRSENLLGETKTDNGRYNVEYKKEQLQKAEKRSADIVVKVLDPSGNQLYKTPIYYNAPNELEVNININNVQYTGPSEWETIEDTLTPLLEGLSVLELREDDQFQDVSFLAGETGMSENNISTWAVCYHLNEKTVREKTPLAASIFYAFLRQGQPALAYDTLMQDIQNPERSEVLKDKVIRELSAIAPKLQRQLLEKAWADNLSPAPMRADLDSILKTLNQIMLNYAADSTFGAGKGTISQLLSLTPGSVKEPEKFVATLNGNTGSMQDLWKKLEDDKIVEKDALRDVKLNFELGALTRNHIPLVAKLNSEFKNGKFTAKRDLAKLDRPAWVELFKSQYKDGQLVGVPDNIDGDTQDETFETYAAILEQRFERSYPTTSFMAKLDRTADSPIASKSDVVQFLDKNPYFHLDRFHIDQYVKENAGAFEGIQDKAAVMGQLKSIQRVFKLKPTFQAVDALLTRNIHSAQQIYFMGKEQFVTALKDTGLNQIESKKMYQKATNAYAMALTLFGNYNRTINGVLPAAAPSLGISLEQEKLIETLPNLQTLFGSLDFCECTHCRSVYGPAAHFVDIMRFLSERNTNGTGINVGKNLKDVLLNRRPDLGEMELSCENTNTPLPYIDLINEILEEVVAIQQPIEIDASYETFLVAGTIQSDLIHILHVQKIPIANDADVYSLDSRNQWAIRDKEHAYKIIKSGTVLQILPTKQTHLTAAELSANSEYTNPAAYDKLASEIFPFNLPFDLWHLQTSNYLNHLGVSLPRLFELFQQKLAEDSFSPNELQIKSAWLGINETNTKIITGTLTERKSWDFWGLSENDNDLPHPDTPTDPTTNITGSWVEVLSHVPIMLHRTGLSYQELLQLLDMQSVNFEKTIFIEDNTDSNAANCDASKFMIRGLIPYVLDWIHRFIRLWRHLGCSMWELDMLPPDTEEDDPAVVAKDFTESILKEISQMARLKVRFNWDWRTTLALYRNIDHNIYFDRSLPDAPAVQTLYQSLFRNKLVDATAVFPENPDLIDGPIQGDDAAIPQIPDKVPGLLAAFSINEDDLNLILANLELTTASTLDWTVVSQIYRNTLIAKALDLNIDDFLRLKKLSGIDPFADPKNTLEFLKFYENLQNSGFTISELDFLLNNTYNINAGVALEDNTIIAIFKELREGLQKLVDETSLKPEETPEAYIKAKLGLLSSFARDSDQSNALAIINGTWIDTTTSNRNTLIDNYFLGILDLTIAKANFAPAPPDGTGMSVENRFLYFQPALQEYLLKSQKEIFIKQTVASVFKLEVPAAELLLSKLKLSGATNTLVQNLNDPKLLQKNPDGTYQFEVKESAFVDGFRSLRLLYKNAMIIDTLKIKSDELLWWLDGSHANDLNWPNPGDFPIDNTASVAVSKWLNFVGFFMWKAELQITELTPFEFLDGVLNVGTDEVSTIALLAKLTTWEETEIKVLVDAFKWDVKKEFKDPQSHRRLTECFAALRRLGIKADRAIVWAGAQPSFAISESIKQTVKSKYDLSQWQQVIKPLQDVFREQKRDALVSWLTTRSNPNWMDTNALYSYFLIDVEMGACMLTSRLKQAAASAQLFVQRCLMNLETDITVRAEKTDDTDTLADSKWKQWQWMKYYRVWEANRKVFLYPENWIEPELRDEKSPFFKELENELIQNDVNAETAEQAYRNYLEKLDKVANLEISTIFNEYINATESTLHVFARTRSSMAPKYYYRKRINNARWTAWENIDLDIQGNHLVAGIHNRRMYLLWPQLIEKADVPTTVNIPSANTANVPIPQPNKYWETRLFWSELKKGKWTPKILSDSFVKMNYQFVGGREENIQLKLDFKIDTKIRIYINGSPTVNAPFNIFSLDKIGSQIDVGDIDYTSLITPIDAYYQNNMISNNGQSLYFYYGVSDGTSTSVSPHEGADSILLLENQGLISHTVVDSTALAFSDFGSFFIWNPNRSYFVDYGVNRTQNYYSKQWHVKETYNFIFYIHYHPFVELFIKELNIWGIKGLLNRRIQTNPQTLPGSPSIFNFADYKPVAANVAMNYELPDKTKSYPVEDVDFSYAGAYSLYNWELFFHTPFYIANKLANNQRFEEALSWYHYIFNPTNTDNAVIDPETPQQKYWITKPFYETTKADYYKQKIENLLLSISKGDNELRMQVEEWRNNPFNPHLIARMRTVAYQKNVLIKYIQTLIAWGDQLFSRNTIETINEATQLYILADSVLGPRPKSIPKKINNPIKTYYQLEREGIDAFGNVLMEVENLLPSVPATFTMGEESPELPNLSVLYFCIPNNDNLLALWNLVDDRLFKIRHCMNIEGVVQQLPLFDPPIDPAALVRAVAGGLDISSALAEMNAPMPLYRFNFMIQKALELCAEVKALGAAMLSALEKKDAEAFALLRSSQEIQMMDSIRDMKNKQIEESLRTWESIIEARKVVDERKNYYEKLVNDGWNAGEITAFSLSTTSTVIEASVAAAYIISGGLKLIPTFLAGASGFGGSPQVSASIGGQQIGNGAEMAARTLQSIGAALDKGASMSSTVASYSRRAEEWDFQKRVAQKELPQIDKQLAAADIRKQMADIDLHNHDKQKANLEKDLEYMQSKFSNQELYDWFINKMSTVYFQSYQLAFDVAKRAERCFRYEIGISDSNYIQFGYWDTLKKGLLSGEKLHYDLKRLEAAYYEQNRREYELTKHISLDQLDPVALLKLRQNGECLIDIPETFFDMDYPGHYFRRMKTVALSIPCIAGPFATIACTLTLTRNSLRKDSTLLGGKYERDLAGDDIRFRDEIATIQSIATSGAQSDNGLFELNFRDERYLPFEGAGAISSWKIKLNKDFKQFDLGTISDVIIHLKYTAREGGDALKNIVVQEFNKKMNSIALAENKKGLFKIFDIKHEFSTAWNRFLHPAAIDSDQQLILTDLQDRLPFFTKTFATKKVSNIEVLVLAQSNADVFKIMLSPLGTTDGDLLVLASGTEYQGLHNVSKDLTGNEVEMNTWTVKIKKEGAVDFRSLPADALLEMFLIVNYSIS